MKPIINIFNILSKRMKLFTYAILFLMTISMIIETLSIAVLIPAITFLVDENFSNNFPNIFNFLILISSFLNLENFSEEQAVFFSGIIILILIFLVKTLFLVSFFYLQNKYVYSQRLYLSKRLLAAYLKSPLSFHIENNSSELLRNILNEIGQVIGTLYLVITLINELLILAGILILLLYSNFLGAFVSIIVLGTIGYVIYAIHKKKIVSYGKLRQKTDEEKLRFLQESFMGIKAIKIQNKEDFFIKKFSEPEILSGKIFMKFNVILDLPRLVFEFTAVLTLSSLLIVLSSQGVDLTKLLSTLGLFAIAAIRLLPSVNRILSGIQSYRFTKPAMEKVYNEIVNAEKNIDFSNKEQNLERSEISFRENISLKNIFYNHNGRESVLENVDLKIKFGETIGIVGPSGAGKSTLIELIIGFINPKSGSILVDNKPISQNKKSWQKQIGYVPQSLFLLDDTLERNIAFGLEDKHIDKLKIQKALAESQLINFVENLEKKEKTIVGENGIMISGGEKKRIGIARALYNQPKVLILDEPTNELDKDTEKNFLKFLSDLKKKITIIIISHNIKSLNFCDKIYEIKNKNLLETKN